MISPQLLHRTSNLILQFREMWTQEVPRKIHSHDTDMDGYPQWHPEFERWLKAEGKPHELSELHDTIRLRKAMQRLRRDSIREYEAVFRVLVLHESAGAVARWLNNRASRRGLGDRYTKADATTILYAAIEKLADYY